MADRARGALSQFAHARITYFTTTTNVLGRANPSRHPEGEERRVATSAHGTLAFDEEDGAHSRGDERASDFNGGMGRPGRSLIKST